MSKRKGRKEEKEEKMIKRERERRQSTSEECKSVYARVCVCVCVCVCVQKRERGRENGQGANCCWGATTLAHFFCSSLSPPSLLRSPQPQRQEQRHYFGILALFGVCVMSRKQRATKERESRCHHHSGHTFTIPQSRIISPLLTPKRPHSLSSKHY